MSCFRFISPLVVLPATQTRQSHRGRMGNRQRQRYIYREGHGETGRDRERQGETERETERNRERHRETERDREIQKTDRGIEGQRETETNNFIFSSEYI